MGCQIRLSTSCWVGRTTAGNIVGTTAASAWASEASIVQTMKRAGCKVYIGTVLSQIGAAPGYGGAYDAFKDAFDAVQLEQWKAIGADGIIDFAAQSAAGCRSGCRPILIRRLAREVLRFRRTTFTRRLADNC